MKLFAPAKVNLYLRITGRRGDGYHLLDSLMVPISLGDDLSLTRVEGRPGSFTLWTDNSDVPLGEENTVHRAVRVFRERTDEWAPVAVEIRKRIPMGAGLGGGSTNAAAVLRGMNELFGAGLSTQELVALAVSVGADVPFFILGEAARVRGIGEQLSPAGPLPKLWMVVLFPNFPISTAWAYRNFRFKLTNSSNNNNLIGNLDTPHEVAQVMFNDLETVIVNHYPHIAGLKARLKESGAIGSLMSGSGSCVFGLFADQGDAKRSFVGFKGEKDIRAFLAFSLT